MELPKLGEHCSQEACNRLDFLPMKCDACKEIFCKDHVQYAKHNCKNSYMKDVQVPVCPLCNQPVPTKRGQPPDITVGEHIDRYCQSDPAKAKRKIYTNKCSVKGCKQKEVVKISCDDCKQTFCLKHRLPQDHNCQKVVSHPKIAPHHISLASGKQQISSKASHHNKWNGAVSTSAAVQPSMSEDEAMALAIQQSLLDSSKTQDASLQKQLQEEEDHLLAQALAASERSARSRQSNQPEKNSCLLS